MFNVLLTNECKGPCTYCYKKTCFMKTERQKNILWEDIIYIADFLQNSRINSIDLWIKDTSSHPDFIDIILYFLNRKFSVTAHVCGEIKRCFLEKIKTHENRFKSKECVFMLNINEECKNSLKKILKINIPMHSLNQHIMLDINFYRPKIDFVKYINLILKFNLKKEVRISLIRPLPPADKNYFKMEDIELLIANLHDFMPICLKERIKLVFNCGFPLCKFQNAQIGALWKISKDRLKFRCDNKIYISSDMEVWDCFPGYHYKKRSLFEFVNSNKLDEYYKKIKGTMKFEEGGMYDECETCEFFEKKLCTRGCMAYVLNKHTNEPRIRFSCAYRGLIRHE